MIAPASAVRPTRPRLVLFDFDGTLADSWPWFRAELPLAIQRWRLRPISDGGDGALRRLPASAVLKSLGVPGWKLPWIAADLRRRMTAAIAADPDRIRPFPGVAALLRTLAGADAPPLLALVSSNSATNVARVLGPALWGLFAAHDCGVPVGGKAARLRRLSRRLRVAPEAALYIGDELRDIAAARRAGIPVGAVTWGYNDPAVLRQAGPDLLFERVGDIARHCLGVPEADRVLKKAANGAKE